MRSRFLTLSISLVLAVLVGGADGCSSDPNVEGAKLDMNNGDYARALSNIDEALTTNPDNVDALVLKTEIYRRQYEAAAGAQAKRDFLTQNFDEMVSTARRARDLAPDDDAAQAAVINTWALAVNAGNTIVRDDDADAAVAIPILTSASQLVPDSSQAYLSLGLAYLRTGEAARAIAPLERAEAIHMDDPIAAYYHGRALLLAERGTEAVTVLEAAQNRFPDDQDIQTMLLNAYTSTGQTDQAMERYADAVEAQPTDPVIRYNYGALLLGAGRYDEAIVQLQSATQLSPDNADAFYNLGAAYQNKATELSTEANASEDNDEADRLFAERDRNLEMAIAPLVRARELVSGTDDERDFCNALFQVYGNLSRVDDQMAVAECAGISTN